MAIDVSQRRSPRSGWTQLRRFVLLAFMCWPTAHFLTGGWV